MQQKKTQVQQLRVHKFYNDMTNCESLLADGV